MLPFSSAPLVHCAGFPIQRPGGTSPTPAVTTSWDQESHCRQTRAILPSHYTSHSEEGVAGDQGPSPLTRPYHAMGCHEYMLLLASYGGGRRNLCPHYIFFRPFLASSCGQCGTGHSHSSLQDIYISPSKHPRHFVRGSPLPSGKPATCYAPRRPFYDT